MKRFDSNISPEVASKLAALPVQTVRTPEALASIEFTDGLAAVMVSSSLLRQIPFKNEARWSERRVSDLAARIRRYGYLARDPIICRIGRRGKWVVVDGGHRLSALHQLRETGFGEAALGWLRALKLPPPRWLRRAIEPRVYEIYFILFTGVRSLELSKVKPLTPR